MRDIIEIDREKCNGCGLCTKACAEGALVMDNENKAILVKEIFCDGLGACLDVCPTGALKIVKRECADYDAGSAYQHVMKTQGADAAKKVHKAPAAHSHGGGCPGTMARSFDPSVRTSSRGRDSASAACGGAAKADSEISQWPIQLHLVSPMAPYFKECDLLVAADCTAFALGSFHSDLLKGKKLVIACPKLDDTGSYVAKLAEMIKKNRLRSLTVAIMVVPCCTGLLRMVEEAVVLSGEKLNVRSVVVGIEGQMVQDSGERGKR